MTTFHFRALQAVQAVDIFFRCLGRSALGLRWKPGGAGANDLALFASDMASTAGASPKNFLSEEMTSSPPAEV